MSTLLVQGKSTDVEFLGYKKRGGAPEIRVSTLLVQGKRTDVEFLG